METHSEECETLRHGAGNPPRQGTGISPDTRTLLESIRGLRQDLDTDEVAAECLSSQQSLRSAAALTQKLVIDPCYRNNEAVRLAAARIVNAVDNHDVELRRILSCIRASLDVIESELAAAIGEQADESEPSMRYA